MVRNYPKIEIFYTTMDLKQSKLLILIIFILSALVNINTVSTTTEQTTIDVEWNNTFGGTATDAALSVIQTSDGGFALAGIYRLSGPGSTDMQLVKTNATGHHAWNNTFGGTTPEEASSVIQTSDGGFVLAGTTNSYGAGSSDMWLVKTNTTGHHEWNNTFGGTASDQAFSLIQTSDGGFALAGRTTSYGAGSSDVWLVKTNSNGQHEWNNTFGGQGIEWASSVIQTSDGGFALAGYTNSYGAGGDDMWLVKTDTTGHHEWNNTFGGQGIEWANSVIQTSDSGFALAGYTESYGAGSSDMWLVKTDTTGHHEWNNTFGGTAPDRASSVIQTSDSGFALAGYTESYGAGDWDMWLVKTDTTGHHEWNNTFGGTASDQARSLIQTSDGGFALAGYTWSYGAGYADMWLVKIICKTGCTFTNITPSWTLLIVIMSLLVIMFRKRMKNS